MKWSRWLIGGVLALGVTAVVLWWCRPVPLLPPMPPDIEDDEMRDAIRAAQQPVLAEPRSAEAWGRLGTVILAQQFDREADVCFLEAIRLNRDDARWHYGRAIIAGKRRPDEAVPLLNDAAEAPACPPNYRAPMQMALAEALLERARLDEADAVFHAEHERDPGNARATLGLGRIAHARGQFELAVQLLTAVRASPHAARAATAQLAALARLQGDPGLAVLYEKQLATLPGDTVWPDPFHEKLGDLYVGQRGWERRVKRLEQNGRFADAARLFQERLDKHPSADLYTGAALNLARLPTPDYDRALALVRAAVRLEPNSSYAHYLLGRILYNRAERAWQSTPRTPELQQAFRESIGHTRRATELRPGYADALLFWGLALKYLGDWQGALEPLRQGVQCRPDDFRMQFVLGEALLEAGLPTEAKTHLEMARQIEPNNEHARRLLDRLGR